MNQLPVSSLQKDMRFEGFLLVRMAEQRTSSNGSKYLDMTLCDKSGDLNAKMWDGSVNPPKVGSVVKVRCTIQEYNCRLQMRVERMRDKQDDDDVDLSFLMPCAPEKPEKMLKEIQDTIEEKNVAEVIVAKQRNGPLGTIKVAWLGEYTLFDNLAGGGLVQD